MQEIVSFHILNRKFLEDDKDIPPSEKSQQVMYYSLAIGHHVGVIDCLKNVMECTTDVYQNWINLFPEGDAKLKFARLFKFTEIFIDQTHVELLGSTLLTIRDKSKGEYSKLTEGMLEILEAIVKEPAMYLMVKLPRGSV